MLMSKISRYVLYALMAISVILIMLFFFGGYVEGTKGTNFAEPLNTNIALIWAFILFLIALITALVFPLAFLIMNPKRAIRFLIGLGAVAVFIFIAYQLGSDKLLNLINYNGPDNVPKTLKLVDTGLILTYALMLVALVSILYNEVSKMFK
jgi:K+ transporter